MTTLASPRESGQPAIDPRVALANERTLLSWMRCALALVAAGATAGTVADISPRWLHVAVALLPISLGLCAAVLGYRRWRRVDHAVRAGIELAADLQLRSVAVAIALIALVAGFGSLVSILSR
jgi:putative membrane protein